MNEAMIAIRDLEFSYPGSGIRVLSIPRLDLEKGQAVVLVGPNGSGKTTFLRLLGGLLPWGTGDFRVDGATINGPKSIMTKSLWPQSLRPRCVYLHQQPYIFSGSVSYNVGLGCRALGMSRDETARKVKEILPTLGLDGFAVRGHKRLSGGEAQRVALARVLACGADILLLDEPTASADTYSAGLIRNVLLERSGCGATILCATHDEFLMDDLPARILEFRQGGIVKDELVERTIRSMNHAIDYAAPR
jgi:energy-coupling factor transporter ATP-binding protein EcfA2